MYDCTSNEYYEKAAKDLLSVVRVLARNTERTERGQWQWRSGVRNCWRAVALAERVRALLAAPPSHSLTPTCASASSLFTVGVPTSAFRAECEATRGSHKRYALPACGTTRRSQAAARAARRERERQRQPSEADAFAGHYTRNMQVECAFHSLCTRKS